jgi:hypothetical protein
MSYVDGPVALLHVVGSEDVANLGQLVEEVVLETEHGGGTDDGGFGVDVADDLLTPGLYSSVLLAGFSWIAYISLTLVAKYSEGESRRAL